MILLCVRTQWREVHYLSPQGEPMDTIHEVSHWFRWLIHCIARILLSGPGSVSLSLISLVWNLETLGRWVEAGERLRLWPRLSVS